MFDCFRQQKVAFLRNSFSSFMAMFNFARDFLVSSRPDWVDPGFPRKAVYNTTTL